MLPLSPEAIDFGTRCSQHAAATPDRPAVILADDTGAETILTWRELDSQSKQLATLLRREGVGLDSVLAIALPTCLQHYALSIAGWRLGACILPLNPDLPLLERQAILDVVQRWRRLTLIAPWSVPGVAQIGSDRLEHLADIAPYPSKEVIPLPGKAIASGGSTGLPKIIVDPKPWAHVPGKWGALSRVGLREAQTQLVVGSLYHNVGFFLSHVGLFEGHTLVVPRRFNAALAADLIERHSVQFAGFLPIMLQRIAKLPDIEKRDFSSFEGLYHSGGACPEWVKRLWLTKVAPNKMWELYGSTEECGLVMANGEEWLERPRSVGRPYHAEVTVLDDEKRPVPPGTVGEIHMRNTVEATALGEHWPQDPGFQYVGAPTAKHTDGDFTSVGDLGSLDSEGYLSLADRRVDLIKSGGINIYPVEIESALSAHPAVQDIVVFGVPDPEWGQRVHALVRPTAWPTTLTADELDSFCRERLTAYKAPKTYEFCQVFPRDNSGKIRRSALRSERMSGVFPGELLRPTGRAARHNT